MKLFFLFKEGIISLNRARLATLVTIMTITLSLALVGIFGLLVSNLSDAFHQIYHKIHLEAFLDPSLSDSQIQALQKSIQNIQAIQSAEYISPAAALEIFEKDMGRDITTILGHNPLPPSLRVVLKSNDIQLNNIENIVMQLKAFPEVDEIVYQENIIHLLNKYYMSGLVTAFVLRVIIFLISTLLIFNTIRLSIHARHTVIEIMRLVGASNFFIKVPFLLAGMLQGFIGGLIASSLLWLAGDFLKTLVIPSLTIPINYLIFLIVVGTLLGLLGSYISVGKYLRVY